jgi:hypothetical protein
MGFFICRQAYLQMGQERLGLSASENWAQSCALVFKRNNVSPLLHHAPALFQVVGVVVYVADYVVVGVGELALDPIAVVSAMIHFG